MEIKISRPNIPSQFIEISLYIVSEGNESIDLQLPSWRPGRYEITNYARKIKGFGVFTEHKSLPYTKKSKDMWSFEAINAGIYEVNYAFHAAQMDAGGSWSDDQQLYLNFINFIFEVSNRTSEKIDLYLPLSENDLVATALPYIQSGRWRAADFQHLVDSPMIISPTLKKSTYQVAGVNFHVWIQGELHFDIKKMTQDFKAFTMKQIKAFGSFPAEDYHFLIQLLPYQHYHGVEHQFSTVITLGPAETLQEQGQMDKLMGVSSHELYHFWNVCRIRPLELLPYDFSKEVYFYSGVVAEGVTTYMGDLFLLKSGYFNLDKYLEILAHKITLEMSHFGWVNQSIAASSFDLWLDGYTAGIPDKKVSIYNRGALIALVLDLKLLSIGSSLHHVMKRMWEVFGKMEKGYSLTDFEDFIAHEMKDSVAVKTFFENFIWGTADLLPVLQDQLYSVGIGLMECESEELLAGELGIILDNENRILKIHPESEAFSQLMLGDQILAINGQPIIEKSLPKGSRVSVSFQRWGKTRTVELKIAANPIFKRVKLRLGKDNEKRRIWIK